MTRLSNRLSSLVSAFLRWWGGELVGLVPQRVRTALARRARRIDIELSPDRVTVRASEDGGLRELGRIDRDADDPAGMADALRHLTARLARKSPEVVLSVSESMALRRVVTLPAAAAENLREVLSFEMDRFTPFKASEVYFDYRIRDAQLLEAQIRVDLLVVPRSDADWGLDLLRSAGLNPTRLDAAGQDGAAGLNLLPRQDGGTAWPWPYRAAAAFGGLAVLLLAAQIWLPLYQQRQTLDNLETAVATARAEALETEKLKERLDKASRQGRQLVDLKERRPASIALLAEVTRLLPDNTWLVSLDLRGDTVTLSGFSAKASALIAVLEASEMLEDVQFRSPVSLDPRTEKERFLISARTVGAIKVSSNLPRKG